MAKNEIRFKAEVESVSPECVDANHFEQRVEKRAHELYVRRGFETGHEWEDWFEAEKIVKAEINTVDRDCIRSESFYKATHKPDPLPSYIDAKKFNANPALKNFQF